MDGLVAALPHCRRIALTALPPHCTDRTDRRIALTVLPFALRCRILLRTAAPIALSHRGLRSLQGPWRM